MRPEHDIIINAELCDRCGKCFADCPDNVIRMTSEAAEYNGQFCVRCGHCVAICPKGAVTITGYDDPPEALGQNGAVDPDALLALIKARRSMRQFTKKDVPPDVIAKIIEAGRFAPTGGNKQGVSFAVIRDEIDSCERIAMDVVRRLLPKLGEFNPYIKNLEIGDHFLFKGAPVVIVVKSVDVIDGALAASLMEIMAQSLGLGVLYSGFFTMAINESDELKRLLEVTDVDKVVTTMVVGDPGARYLRTAQRESARVTFV